MCSSYILSHKKQRIETLKERRCIDGIIPEMLKYGRDAAANGCFSYVTMHGDREKYLMSGGKQLLYLCTKRSVVRMSVIIFVGCLLNAPGNAYGRVFTER